MNEVFAVDLPETSALRPTLARASFHDSYAASLADDRLSPIEIFLRASRATPEWVGALMAIRNAVVRRLGLKDVGAMAANADKSAQAYVVGDRLGIFSIYQKRDEELVLGIDDSHLDVRVSVLKRPGRYVFSTVVTVHNWLGRLYMVPVGRIHPFVVRAMMRRAKV
jgi:hypothetical protein